MNKQNKQIPTGYKQTELGIIPVDWEVKSISDVVKNMRLGGNYPNQQTPATKYLVKMGNIGRGSIIVNKFEYIPENVKVDSNHMLTYGDLLFNTRNTLDLVGKVAVWRNEVRNAYYNSNLLKIDFEKSEIVNTFYANYLFNSKQSLAQLSGYAIGTTSVAAIYTRDLLNFQLVKPTLIEQEKIAHALSDIDSLITKLSQLIQKKRHIKQGAMQELLTGKRRLPGFSGEWEAKQLGELGIFRGGSGFPTRYQGIHKGTYPFYKVSDMNNEGNTTFMIRSNNWISDDTKKQLGVNTFPKNTLVFAKIGAAVFLERKRILFRESCIDNNMMGFVVDEKNVDFRFIHFLFLTIKLGKLVSATALPSLNGRQVADLSFSIPPISEQAAIAHALSDMDTEIEALEKQKAKYIDLKQGMMQQLLTGKIRLV